MWDLFDCLQTYKKIIKEEEKEGRSAHIYINVSTGSKVSSIAGTLACMIWKGTPYYAHMEYNDKKDPTDGLPDEDVTAINEIPVYSINKPKPESLAVLKILDSMKEGRPKMMKKGRLIEELEEAEEIDGYKSCPIPKLLACFLSGLPQVLKIQSHPHRAGPLDFVLVQSVIF